LDDAAQAPHVDRIPLRRFGVVPAILEGDRIDQPRRPHQLQQIVAMVGAPRTPKKWAGGPRPAAAASSATNDWTAKACGTLDTDRNQPIRVCATASGFSMRRLGMSYGMLIRPMPCSNGASCLGSGPNSETMLGATLRCSQATGLPRASSPACR